MNNGVKKILNKMNYKLNYGKRAATHLLVAQSALRRRSWECTSETVSATSSRCGESDPSFGSVTAGAPGGASGRSVVGIAGASGHGLPEAVPPYGVRARAMDIRGS